MTENEFFEKGTEVTRFCPKKAEETEEIINFIRSAPAIVNLSLCRGESAQRIADILCGAVYALNKKICPLDKDNYLIISG